MRISAESRCGGGRGAVRARPRPPGSWPAASAPRCLRGRRRPRSTARNRRAARAPRRAASPRPRSASAMSAVRRVSTLWGSEWANGSSICSISRHGSKAGSPYMGLASIASHGRRSAASRLPGLKSPCRTASCPALNGSSRSSRAPSVKSPVSTSAGHSCLLARSSARSAHSPATSDNRSIRESAAGAPCPDAHSSRSTSAPSTSRSSAGM